MGLAKSLKANQGKSIGKWEVFPSSKFDSGAVPVRRSRSLRGRGRLISFDITPTTFQTLCYQGPVVYRRPKYSAEAECFHYSALVRTPAVGVRRCLSGFSPLFLSICYVILISSNTWTLLPTGSSSIGVTKLNQILVSNGRVCLSSNISRQKFLCQNGAFDVARPSLTKSFSSLPMSH